MSVIAEFCCVALAFLMDLLLVYRIRIVFGCIT